MSGVVNTVILNLTLRQVLGRRRSLLMAGFGLLPVVIAIIFRLSDTNADQQEWTAQVLLSGFVTTSVLPLVGLVFGTAALGAEIEDGTAVYLLAKPVPRAEVIGAKLLASWIVTAAVVVTSTVLSGVIGLWGVQEDGILLGFLVAGVLGSLVYTALFLALSIITSRALIAGLVYVFLWEGLVTSLFSGTRIFSIRHYTLGLADWLARVPNNVFEAELNGVAALLGMVAVSAGAILVAVRRLEAFEIGEQS